MYRGTDPVPADKRATIAFLDLTNYPENAINFRRMIAHRKLVPPYVRARRGGKARA